MWILHVLCVFCVLKYYVDVGGSSCVKSMVSVVLLSVSKVLLLFLCLLKTSCPIL